MKTRFRKVWCHTCQTMQFEQECPHDQGPTRWRTVVGLTRFDLRAMVRQVVAKLVDEELGKS